jgi:carboxyl-terminal processing protease
MSYLSFKSRKVLSSLVLGLVLSICVTTKGDAAFKDSPKALVDQAWQIIQRNYVDRTFNHQDWTKLRSKYLQSSYTSKESAYRAIQGMLDSLGDPYTRFLTPDALKELTQNVSGEFVGVGLTVSRDPKTRQWVVEKAFPESPAATAGLQPQDIIVSLNGKATSAIEPANAAPYLVGPVGSKVAVQVRRQQKNLQFSLVREAINLNPLTYQTLATRIGKVGYIRLPIFTTKSAASMQNALKTLESQQVSGYLLDLRGNPGGILDAGIAIAQMWLSQGTVVSVQEKDNPRQTVTADRQSLTAKPLVVLVDRESASASEVLSAALQDNKRAVLVGTTTLGKGLVQSFEPLNDNSGVLVTIAKYFTPKGQNIHKTGIKPDISVESSGGEIGVGESDRQYQTALTALGQLMQRKAPSK